MSENNKEKNMISIPVEPEAKKEEKPAEVVPETASEETDSVVVLSKPYVFEGKEYNKIDLSGVANLTINDAVEAQKQLDQITQVTAATTTEFALILAQRATGYPIEFFKLAPRGVARKIRLAVLGILADKTDTSNHIMKLNKPFTYEGATYTEIDLNGLADMTCMNESEAENRLVREGYGIIEPTKNYLYCCILASMATGKSEDFFKKLPVDELIKLVNEVGSEDFLE